LGDRGVSKGWVLGVKHQKLKQQQVLRNACAGTWRGQGKVNFLAEEFPAVASKPGGGEEITIGRQTNIVFRSLILEKKKNRRETGGRCRLSESLRK